MKPVTWSGVVLYEAAVVSLTGTCCGATGQSRFNTFCFHTKYLLETSASHIQVYKSINGSGTQRVRSKTGAATSGGNLGFTFSLSGVNTKVLTVNLH